MIYTSRGVVLLAGRPEHGLRSLPRRRRGRKGEKDRMSGSGHGQARTLELTAAVERRMQREKGPDEPERTGTPE
jgi:hypothetical protein